MMADEHASQAEDVTPERAVAGAIDFALIVAIGALLTLPAYVFGYEHSMWPDYLLIGAAIIVYFPGCEWRFGATAGKFLFGLRVVSADGTSLSFGQVVVRNVLRAVDGLPILYWVGLSSISLTRRRQRIGDLVAHTVVVSRSPHRTGAEQERWVLAALAVGLVLLGLASLVVVWAAVGVVHVRVVAIVASALSAAFVLAALKPGAIRYTLVATVISTIAVAGCGTAWIQRDGAASDHVAEIKAKIERSVPPGTPFADVVSFLEASHVAHDTNLRVAEGNEWYLDPPIPRGDLYLAAFFPHATSGWICDFTLRAYFVIADGKLLHVSYVLIGEDCP